MHKKFKPTVDNCWLLLYNISVIRTPFELL